LCVLVQVDHLGKLVSEVHHFVIRCHVPTRALALLELLQAGGCLVQLLPTCSNRDPPRFFSGRPSAVAPSGSPLLRTAAMRSPIGCRSKPPAAWRRAATLWLPRAPVPLSCRYNGNGIVSTACLHCSLYVPNSRARRSLAALTTVDAHPEQTEKGECPSSSCAHQPL